MNFAIVDIETTGGAAKNNKITEIAIVISDGKKILDQYSSLVNPERPIPPFITNMTGISNKMVRSAPKFYEIAADIIRLFEGCIFVAHNVRFDYSFIKEEFNQLGYTFSMQQLCTVRLSRKTYPQLTSHSLGNLIKHFSISVKNRHRALDDAIATAELFHKMLTHQKTLKDIRQTVHMGIKDSAIPEHLSMDTIAMLPNECGVYRFLDQNNTPLYIGKSKDIKSRVLQHFKTGSAKSKWLQKRAHNISYEVTGSELIALLKENDEIKHHRPELNIAQKHTHFPFGIYSHQSEEGYIKFFIGKHPLKTRRSMQLLRLFTTKRGAKGHMDGLLEKHGLCAKLCGLDASGLHCFRYDIHACQGACIQLESPKDYNKRAALAKSSIMDYFDKDFIIRDTGRTQTEDAFIFIKNGICVGWSYGQVQEHEQLTPIKYPIGANALIRQFLKKSLTAQIIPLPTCP